MNGFCFSVLQTEGLNLCLESFFDFMKVSICIYMYIYNSNLDNVLMPFLHNRAAESHDIWWDCST